MQFNPSAISLLVNPVVFRDNLLNWFRQAKRDLPWRHTRDPYAIWVSEVMLQQTRVDTVIPYYEAFMRQFDTLPQLAMAQEQAVLKAWEGLGYYARARNLHRSAQVVVDQHQGRVPEAWEALRRLPGIGEYIAAAISSIAFGQPRAVLDGNVKRVLSRLMCLEAPVNMGRSHALFHQLAQELLNFEAPGTHNQAMMELGALICTPRQPDCLRCPVVSACRAQQRGTTGQYPVRQAKAPVPLQHIAVGIIRRADQVLITRRPSEGLLGGLWEFPGGKQRAGENPAEACRREIAEEVGLTVHVDRQLTRVRHAYTHFKIVMTVFLCDYLGGTPKLKGPVDYRWVRYDELNRYPFPRANLKFIPLLESGD